MAKRLRKLPVYPTRKQLGKAAASRDATVRKLLRDLLLSPSENVRAEAAKHSIVQIDKRGVPALVRAAEKDSNPNVRLWAVITLGRISGQDKLVSPVLKHAIFDVSRNVRDYAATALGKRVGFCAVADLIEKRYPGSSLSRVPAEFFEIHTPKAERLVQIRGKNSPSVRRIAGRGNSEYGKPAFYHRGFPVFIVPISEENIFRGETLGRYSNGLLLVNSDEKLVPPEFRRAIAEHEFGEIFNHHVANAMEMRWLARHGLLGRFVNEKIGGFQGTFRVDERLLREFEELIRKEKIRKVYRAAKP